MAVVGPDAAGAVAGEALLVAALRHVEDKLAGQRHAVGTGAFDEIVDPGPALGIE